MFNLPAIGIIGTCFRKEDFNKLDKYLYAKIIRKVLRIIDSIGNDFRVVSGGAAGVDDIACFLYRENFAKEISLHLPCEFLKDSQCFSSESKDGDISNYYHENYSRKIHDHGYYSLERLSSILLNTGNYTVGNGFFDRNSKVAAEADYMIAATFGDGAKLKNGGTMDCMRKFLSKNDSSRAFHIDLNTLKAYKGAKV